MRLINTRTLKFEEFLNTDILDYAILSHRWEDEEVSFQEYQQGPPTAKKGYKKILKFCHMARYVGLGYGWIDTCCIDKSSSAELSEAINSMFRWYHDAVVCFVFMSDVYFSTSDASFDKTFRSSAWFTRGWTLQELLAPKKLIFYNAIWQFLGAKEELAELVSQSSRIDTDMLLAPPSKIFSCSVSRRMSWAVHRETTRPEDTAYSLMGIFNVNMPMLYGEGADKAFRRLQEEIIRTNPDHTIFAWSGVEENGSGMLASSINQFTDSASFVSSGVDYEGIQISNVGLTITLKIMPWNSYTYLAFLNCGRGRPDTVIYLKRLGRNSYMRVKQGLQDIQCMPELYRTATNMGIIEERRISVLHNSQNLNLKGNPWGEIYNRRLYGVSVGSSGPIDIRKFCNSLGLWDSNIGVAKLDDGPCETVVTIDLQNAGTEISHITVGLNFDLRPVAVFTTSYPGLTMLKCTKLSNNTSEEVYLQPSSYEKGYWKFSMETDYCSRVFIQRRDEVMASVRLEFLSVKNCWHVDFDTTFFRMLQDPQSPCQTG